MNIKIIGWIARLMVTLIGRTLRIKNVGAIPKGKVIYAFWHSDFFPLIYANRFKNIAVLVSTHKDGEYLSKVIEPLGYRAIRGSSDDGGKKGALQILKSNEDGIAIAPDGPKGPVKQVKEGVVKIAQLTKLPIVPVGVWMSNPIIFGSWDRFKIPLPFSKCIIYWGKPIEIKESTKEMKRKVESVLIEANEYAYRLI